MSRGGIHSLSEMLNGRTPIIRHTWQHTLSLYPSAKSKVPCARIDAKDDRRISVLKLALYFVCAASALVLAALLIKRVRDKIRRKKRERELARLVCTEE